MKIHLHSSYLCCNENDERTSTYSEVTCFQCIKRVYECDVLEENIYIQKTYKKLKYYEDFEDLLK